MKHTVGNWYKCDGEFYILAQVAENQFCLVGISGNRWANPISCQPVENFPQVLSEEDFSKVAQTLHFDVQLVKTAMPNRLLKMINDCSFED